MSRTPGRGYTTKVYPAAGQTIILLRQVQVTGAALANRRDLDPVAGVALVARS